MERLLPVIEAALGPEARELVNPLSVISAGHRRLGNLADSYTVMLRTMTVCEKHHGEEGLATCQLRSKLGESLSRCGWEVSLSAIFDTFSRFPTHPAYR